MADFTRAMTGGDMAMAMESMKWLERAERRRSGGCSVCKHQREALGATYCNIEHTPFDGQMYCGRWADE